MQQTLSAIHEYAPLIVSFLLALSSLLGTLLAISEKLALNTNVKYSGIVHFFKLAGPALRVAKEGVDTATGDIVKVEKEIPQGK